MTPEELLAECPDLTAEESRAWLAFAAHRERKLATLPAHVEQTITDEFYGEVNCSFTHSIVFSASEQIRKTSCTVFGPT